MKIFQWVSNRCHMSMQRHLQSQQSSQHCKIQKATKALQLTLAGAPPHSVITDPALLDQKRS